jgi:uncharacterized lipoprotein YajG
MFSRIQLAGPRVSQAKGHLCGRSGMRKSIIALAALTLLAGCETRQHIPG